MRWGSLIVGGIVGVAAAAVVARRRPGALHLLGEATCAVWRNVRHRAAERIAAAGVGQALRQQRTATEEPKSPGAEAADMAMLAGLAASDPVARRETDKILADNGLQHV
ncbi:hypothetical protein PA598K_01003 [Paenibacillus sp. 598K]|uniref:hypothetical protein n=1 Tax=Paenibacillus sp. 598K TaxID=1117987 RepID=UPI000FF9DB82|nr:hypothetical protein [Paenibacillus sp. 598K]GBF72737.1 hypothetical protein PA598K_01003 [Paenibacillus sp. 598K]